MAEVKNFEESLEQLQKIVRQIESGSLSLEDSLKNFEEGVRHIRTCQQYLTTAEKRVEVLTQITPDGQVQLKPFRDASEEEK